MKMLLSFALQAEAEAHPSPPEPLMMPQSRLASTRKATSSAVRELQASQGLDTFQQCVFLPWGAEGITAELSGPAT